MLGGFFRKCEFSFDKRTGYARTPEQTFDYFNTMKNGSPKEIFQMKEWAERVNHEHLEMMRTEWIQGLQGIQFEKGQEENRNLKNTSLHVLDSNQIPLRKKKQEEEIVKPKKKKRGFGMGV